MGEFFSSSVYFPLNFDGTKGSISGSLAEKLIGFMNIKKIVSTILVIIFFVGLIFSMSEDSFIWIKSRDHRFDYGYYRILVLPICLLIFSVINIKKPYLRKKNFLIIVLTSVLGFILGAVIFISALDTWGWGEYKGQEELNGEKIFTERYGGGATIRTIDEPDCTRRVKYFDYFNLIRYRKVLGVDSGCEQF